MQEIREKVQTQTNASDKIVRRQIENFKLKTTISTKKINK